MNSLDSISGNIFEVPIEASLSCLFSVVGHRFAFGGTDVFIK